MIIRFIVEALPDVAIVKQVVHDPEGVVAQLLGYWPEGQDLLWIFYAPVIGNGHAKFHRFLPRRPQNVYKQALLSVAAAHGTTFAQRKRTLAATLSHCVLCYHWVLTTRLSRGDQAMPAITTIAHGLRFPEGP